MRLLLAVSADGFLAKGPDDDMRWTGPIDKAIFRLLTLSNGNDVLLAGSRTFDQMPKLPGRQMERLSRGPGGLSLGYASSAYLDAWLIGGPEVALAALRDQEISRAFLCISPNILGEGVSVSPLLEMMPEEPEFTIKVGDVRVQVFTEDQPWPGR